MSDTKQNEFQAKGINKNEDVFEMAADTVFPQNSILLI
jgi:hypothetical protein